MCVKISNLSISGSIDFRCCHYVSIWSCCHLLQFRRTIMSRMVLFQAMITTFSLITHPLILGRLNEISSWALALFHQITCFFPRCAIKTATISVHSTLVRFAVEENVSSTVISITCAESDVRIMCPCKTISILVLVLTC